MTDYVMADALAELVIDFQGGEAVTVITNDGEKFRVGPVERKGRCHVHIESILAAKGADKCDPKVFPLTIRVERANA